MFESSVVLTDLQVKDRPTKPQNIFCGHLVDGDTYPTRDGSVLSDKVGEDVRVVELCVLRLTVSTLQQYPHLRL